MYCKYCGAEMEGNAVFCPECGRKQDKNTPSGAQTPENAGVNPVPGMAQPQKTGVQENSPIKEESYMCCTKCGSRIWKETVYCPECGSKVIVVQPSGASQPQNVEAKKNEKDNGRGRIGLYGCLAYLICVIISLLVLAARGVL